jgi:hypothetical protein
VLWWRRAQIGPEGAIALAAALKVNPVLASLNLSGTAIGARALNAHEVDEPMVVGAEGMRGCAPAAPWLLLLRTDEAVQHPCACACACTRAGPLGCEALCKALRSSGSSGLKELDLSHTALDDRAAGALAALLTASRVLERLVLTHTNITDAGAQLLCNALQNNGCLQHINVSANDHMDKSWQKLLDHVVKGKARG